MTGAQEVAAGAPADAATFAALLEPILPTAYRLAFGMLRSETDAEDAVQEATLSAWRAFRRFRRDAALRPWPGGELLVTEIEIRDRIRAALGEAEYPEGLGASLAAHLAGAGDRNLARLQTLIAALLVLTVLSAVALPRLARDYAAWTSSARAVPVAGSSPAITAPLPGPSAAPAALPAADLEAAGLADTPGAVTLFGQSATDSGYTVTLIGLYVDSSRTIVFLHVEPDLGFPGSVSLADQQGASGSGNRGAPGDYVYRLAAAPRAGADGYADVTITVFAGPPYAVPKRLPGNWVFTARVRPQP